jgi:hypothetical protein
VRWRLTVDLLVDVLRLSAGPEGRHHDPPGNRDRDIRAVVFGDEVEAQVDPGGGARRGHDAIVRDVEDVGVDVHTRKAPAEPLGVHPVRRRAPAVEQTGEPEDEGAGAERDDPCAAVVRVPQLAAERLGGPQVRVDPAGDDDRVRPRQLRESVWSLEVEAGVRADRRRAGGDELEVVPGVDDVAAVVPEDLRRDREVERERPLVDDGRDAAHVRNLAIIG